MDLGLHVSLRVALLALGGLFVLAILVDGLRRKYRRKRRLATQDIEHEYSDDSAYVDDIEPVFATEAKPYVDAEEFVTLSMDDEVATDDAPKNDTLVMESGSQKVLVVYVKAKAEKPYVGYELLQALLSVGLRFGEMGIFHRYESLHAEGKALFSLASSKAPGEFDIHNMGVVSCDGLSLFMRIGNDRAANVKNFDLMLESANQLIVDLGGSLLDDSGHAFTAEAYKEYRRYIDKVSMPVPVAELAEAIV